MPAPAREDSMRNPDGMKREVKSGIAIDSSARYHQACLRLATASKPRIPEQNNHTAAGTGTGS